MSCQTIAIIPARSGSKRIPRKNLVEVAGDPLVAHTIKQANKSDQIDQTVVSTDDEEIADVAVKYGGEVPFMRPEEFATDTSPLANTVTHAIDQMDESETEYERICVLQVTTPLRTPEDIDGALRKLDETYADSCISISEYATPPQWAVTTDEDNSLYEFFDSGTLWTDSPVRSQEIQKLHHPNGAVFATSVDAWRRYESFYMPHTVGYKMPPDRSFDIDEPWELDLVRSLLE